MTVALAMEKRGYDALTKLHALADQHQDFDVKGCGLIREGCGGIEGGLIWS